MHVKEYSSKKGIFFKKTGQEPELEIPESMADGKEPLRSSTCLRVSGCGLSLGFPGFRPQIF